MRKLHIELMVRDIMMGIHPNLPPDPFQEEEEWIAFWKLVGQLKGLKSLSVKVVGSPPFWRYGPRSQCVLPATTEDIVEGEDRLLDPLRAITTVEQFNIILPQECQQKRKADARFRLRFLSLLQMHAPE
jgi:hypothetical protein